jgi:hypothetical protein
MRRNGIDLPRPNTTGRGPIFTTKGLDVHSSRFSAATVTCRPTLSAAIAAEKPTARARKSPAGKR